MKTKDTVLGIDTSNYTTSAALINRSGEILSDLRSQLTVKQGERGLRQSHALFQHIETLPHIIEEAIGGNGEKIGAVAVSERPRPLETSYMPVFKAGESFAVVISSALGIPVYKFSHQENHIEAVRHYSGLKDRKCFLCFHLSGGTCELLRVMEGSIEILGGSRDISFGQLIDRTGVHLGLPFPCGAEFDRVALKTDAASNSLKEIPIRGFEINLSGIETQSAKLIKVGLNMKERDALIKEILNKTCNVLIKMIENAVYSTNLHDILFVGGVSSSKFISAALRDYFCGGDVSIDFGNQRFASDNAVGTALLGRKKLWL